MPALPLNPRRIAAAAGLLVVALLVIEFNTRLDELNRLAEKRDRVRVEATQSMQTQVALHTAIAYGGSVAAAEAWARSEGHYMMPGDRPVVPLGGPGEAPAVASTPTAIATSPPNWQIWWDLFFSE